MSDTIADDPLITREDGFEGLDRAFDAWYVARATVKSDDGTGFLHVLVAISAPERANKRRPEDEVLARASTLRDALVRVHREEARSLTGHKTIRAWWNDPLPSERDSRPSARVATQSRS
jgi:hypothetical protein